MSLLVFGLIFCALVFIGSIMLLTQGKHHLGNILTCIFSGIGSIYCLYVILTARKTGTAPAPAPAPATGTSNFFGTAF